MTTAPPTRPTAPRALRGFTVVEILIVLAIVGVGVAVAIGVDRGRERGRAERRLRLSRVAVIKYADEAYPQWSMHHPGKICPDSIAELAVEEDQKEAVDAWDNPLVMLCGDRKPAGVRGGIGIVSAGEDGLQGTADDLKSWDRDDEP